MHFNLMTLWTNCFLVLVTKKKILISHCYMYMFSLFAIVLLKSSLRFIYVIGKCSGSVTLLVDMFEKKKHVKKNVLLCLG